MRSLATDRAPSLRATVRSRITGGWLTILGAVVVLVVCFVLGYPLLSVLLRLFIVDGRLDFGQFAEVFQLRGIGTVLLNTVIVVTVSGVLAVALGSIFAWLNERTDAHLGRIGGLLPLLPLLVPPIASSVGWTFLLSDKSGFLNVGLRALLAPLGFDSRSGPLNVFSWPGLILAYTAYLTPYAYLTVSAALRNLDPALEEAARISGAGRWRTLRTVTLPAVGPAVATAGVLVLIMGLALYSIPVIIGTGAGHEVLTVRIVNLLHASFPPQTGVAVVLGGLMLIVIVAASLLRARLARARRFARITGRARSAQRTPLGAWRIPARAAMLLFIFLASALPFLAVLFVSFQRYWSPNIDLSQLRLDAYLKVFVEDNLVRDALLRSVVLGLLGATIGIAMSFVLAVLNHRLPARAARWLSGLIGLPGSLSHVVIAIGFILAFAGPPFNLVNTPLILLLCYITLYLPQTYFNASSAVDQVGDELLEASRIFGASDGRTFRKILLPLSVRGLLAGWTLAFVMILGDLTASVLLAGTSNSVVGSEILNLYTNGTYPPMAALAVVLTIVGALIVGLVSRFVGGVGAVSSKAA